MTDPVFSAVCKLVDAVLIEHCIAVDQHLWHEEHTVDCVLAVLREIRAAEELTSLHNWADNPAQTAAEICAVLRGYGVHEVYGDRYSANWVQDCFRAHGVVYAHSDVDRSAIYANVLPLFTTARACLLDNERLIAQFAALERKTSARGDRIDHPRGQGHHDDAANAAAGALMLASSERYDVPHVTVRGWGPPITEPQTRLQREAATWLVPSTLPASAFGDPQAQDEALRRWMRSFDKPPPQPAPSPRRASFGSERFWK
jgi:hypothetical protein